jgi:hypothetical protein
MSDPVVRVQRWLDEAVIGLQLCPFAQPVRSAGRIRFAVSEARDGEVAVRDTLAEAVQLLDTPAEEVATTLVIVPHALQDFHAFLDALEMLQALLAEGGADGVLQVATFHPDYLFAGEEPEAVSHFTNRAPHPIFHLLREADVEEAVAHHSDAAGIPAENMARLEAMGRTEVLQKWQEFRQ